MLIVTKPISTESPQHDFSFSQVLSSNEPHPNILKVGYVNNNRHGERGRNMHLPLVLVLLLLKLECESSSFHFYKVWIPLITLDQKFILHARKVCFSVTNCIVLFGEYVHNRERIAFINKSKAYAVKTEIVLPFYVQIKASVKPSAVLHLICGNIKISGLILKYSPWGRRYFRWCIAFESPKKSDLKETKWCFNRIYFSLLSLKSLKACWSYTGVWVSCWIAAFGSAPS